MITLFVLMVQLQSLSRTLLVFSTAPLGIIGAAFALLIFGAPFGFVALLGLIALAGLIMRNTVILVDQIDRDEKDGRDTWTAIVESTVRRFRPIMLTASAAVLAMIPLSRSDFFGPQAITILGGLVIATVLTVFYVPALYAAWFRVRRPGTEAESSGESIPPQPTASWRDWLAFCLETIVKSATAGLRAIGFGVCTLTLCHLGLLKRVAYLLAAYIVAGPLPIRLREVNQSVISTRNRFSRPHPCLLTCI